MEGVSSQLSILARQLREARPHMVGETGDREGDPVGAVLATLRRTYLAISTGLDLGTLSAFILEADGKQNLVLRQGDRRIPVDESYLEHVFASAGVQLAPGQLLALDPELAKRVIDESLFTLTLERALEDESSSARPSSREVFCARADRERELILAKWIAQDMLDHRRDEGNPTGQCA